MKTFTRLIRAASVGAAAIFLLSAASPDESVPLASATAFRAWVELKSGRAAEVRAFERFLADEDVSGIFPIHQLLRSESSWARCGGQPFVLAPRSVWPNIAGTLRFIRDRVVPKTGALDIVSGYRTPEANKCAGGAAKSTHVGFWALDMVPAGAISREEMIERLCAVHAVHGATADIGLGFYGGMRFHIDSKRFRRWGADRSGTSSPCLTYPG